MGSGASAASTLPRLMLVTDRRRTRGRDLVPLVLAAARGGAGLIQVREPGLDADALRALVERIGVGLPDGARLVVNGCPPVARETGAGLHLAARMPLPAATAEFPLLGRSVHDELEAATAAAEPVSYLVAGTIYATASKPGRDGQGPELLRRILPIVEPLPLYAIGGVTVSRVPELLHAGAHGVAVCSGLLGAREPERAAQALRLALDVVSGG